MRGRTRGAWGSRRRDGARRFPPGLAPAFLVTGLVLLAAATPEAEAQMTGTAPGVERSPAAAAAAGGIRASDLRHRVGVLAADSMRGRDTPSPELEATAEYVAGKFRAFGLRPGIGESHLQWYPLTVIRPPAATGQEVVFRRDGTERRLAFDRDFVPLSAGGDLEGSGEVEAVTSLEDVEGAAGRILLLPGPESGLGELLRRIPDGLERSGAGGAVVAVDLSEERFAAAANYLTGERIELGEPSPLDAPVVLVRSSALPPSLRRAVDGGGTADGWTARIRSRVELEARRAMNVVGWIEGSDPELRDEYVVFAAHMDHVGVRRPLDGDSIYNGADDDASGTATVVELAQAFAELETPPRRSMVFMTVSGEEKGLLGSRFYVEHPLFPLDRTVAAFNMDMIGRNWRDTVVAIGQDHSTLGATVQRVAREHRPDLGMTVVEDRWPEQRFYYRSDHYNFARKGVPVLFFFSGVHEDYHRPSDEPEKIDYAKTARIGRLVFWTGLEVADADERPRWDPGSYRSIVEGDGSGGR